MKLKDPVSPFNVCIDVEFITFLKESWFVIIHSQNSTVPLTKRRKVTHSAY